ncbi:MAG: hypothetical protein ACKOC5_07870 [Chloroflexota bacterium]
MAKQKYDGVIEAVHYTPEGQVAWVRGYWRMGSIFSDRKIVDRAALIDLLKAGKKLYAGRRIEQMGASFEITKPLKVVQKNGQPVVATGDLQPEKDQLEGVLRI